MKFRMMLLSAAGLLFSLNSLAATCKNANGGISVVNYDLTTTLTTDQNSKGNGAELSRTQDIHVNAICPPGDWEKRTYRTYISPFPVVKTEGEWKYLQLDPDYIIGAMKIHDATIGDFYPPVEYVHMGGARRGGHGRRLSGKRQQPDLQNTDCQAVHRLGCDPAETDV